ncbi:MAG: hypothetical protein K6D90_09215 [Lachnospiraceae bacterium]|nr:hypothetical protein [Lachnospiraceae bacterium]
MNEKNTVRYRGLILHVDKDPYDKYWYLRGRRLSIPDIDQYLIGHADKTRLEPFDIDMNKVLKQFMVTEIEEIINKMLETENRIWAGEGFEFP